MKLNFRTQMITKLCLAASLCALGGSAVRANDLANANLDNVDITVQNNITPVGWAVDAAKSVSGQHFDGCSSEPWCNVLDSGGYGLFFKPFQGTAGDEISVRFYQDNPATPGTKFTLSGYAAGEANYSGFFATNSPAPQTLFVVMFLNSGNTVIASNAFDLVTAGLPSAGPGSMSQLTTPEYTAPVGTVAVRAGVFMLNAYNTTGAQSFFVDALDLNSVAPPGSPVITSQPVATTVAPGNTAVMSVAVSNPSGVTYQWQKNGLALTDGGNISGATTASLTIANAAASDVAHYRVLISNGVGAVYSASAPLALFGLAINPVISITGKAGDTYRIDYATALEPTTWIPLSTNKMSSAKLQVVDPVSATSGNRFYRAVYLP